MQRLVLWDIDGTLVSAGTIGVEVFDRAIEHVLGERPPERVQMSGKTDPQIVGEYLTLLGVDDAEKVLALVLAQLEAELCAAEGEMRSIGRVLPGVVEVLERLAGESEVVQSVLTGNLVANARRKLAVFGLDHFLDLEVGAFGSDHADRNELVPIASARVAGAYGRELSPAEVWVVGDSPNDLACARAGGARCVLVATGHFGFEELAALGADVTLLDLTDTGRVVELLAS